MLFAQLPSTRASIFTVEFPGNERCPGRMWLVASLLAFNNHARVLFAPTTRALVNSSGTKLESPVSEDHHRGQLFRFGLIGDVQASKHTIKNDRTKQIRVLFVRW